VRKERYMYNSGIRKSPEPTVYVAELEQRAHRPNLYSELVMAHHHHCSSSATQTAYPVLNYTPGAKWIKNLTKNRLSTFHGGHFADVNLSSILFTHRLDNAEHVKLQVWSAPGLTKPTFEEAMKQQFKPAKKGDSFGPSCKSIMSYLQDRGRPNDLHRGEFNLGSVLGLL